MSDKLVVECTCGIKYIIEPRIAEFKGFCKMV